MTLLGWIARHPRRRSHYQFIPFNKEVTENILIDQKNYAKQSSDLHKIVRIEVLRKKGKRWDARIIEEFESPDSKEFELDFVAECHGFPTEFPESVISAAKRLQLEDSKGRKDLQNLSFVTIDGEDAKDFDDAIFVKKEDTNFRLLVSIADVSYFVREKDPLDQEALLRGTSIYFPDQVIPMLPEKISNDLCSLRPNEKKFCLTAELLLGPQGEILETEVYSSSIKSQARLTYTQVQAVLDQDESARKIEPEIQSMLKLAQELALRLRKKRQRVGALDLDLSERKVKTDADGKVLEIKSIERNDAHRLIEHFMITANEAVAEAFKKAQLSTLFRVHEAPDPLKLEHFFQVIKHFGFDFEKRELKDPQAFLRKCLKAFENHPRQRVLQYLLLRSMKQAHYSAHLVEHFGLASKAYLHFTSPIRRYPDLIVHRMLRDSLFLRKPQKLAGVERKLEDLALDCSEKEQRAVSAERRMLALKAARYMEERIGEEFKACIVSIKDFGFFVELPDIGVEGLVPMRSLPRDRWQLDTYEMWLEGKNAGLRFEIGDEIEVQLYDVNRMKQQIDFRYLGHLGGARQKQPERQKSARRDRRSHRSKRRRR